MKGIFRCPECGTESPLYKNPFPTVDCLISRDTDDGREGLVLIWRQNEPVGWAIPGGFIDYGESVEDAVQREMLEETNLQLDDLQLFMVCSDPGRDPRFHTIATVFTARGSGVLRAGDDAVRAVVFPLDGLPPANEIVFDHADIIEAWLEHRRREEPGGE